MLGIFTKIATVRAAAALILAGILVSLCNDAISQCNALSSRRDIFFTPSFGCAPTTVSRFEITYYFTLAQNPADIQIQYQWNDPANSVTTINLASGLVVGAGNLSFTANSTFTYITNNGQCSIRPQVSIIVAGVLCPTSTQMQTAPFWGDDDQANGVVAMAPTEWDVCYNNPVVNAVFRDATDFNCNIGVEPDNPNRLTRNVQFVYGTDNVAASSIRNLTLTNGGPQALTDAAGNLSSPQTRGTGTLLVTAGYFGPVDTVPFPADAPTSVSFPMNAPANAANLIGNRFEITLFNWNVCNPWNGDSVNPNYQDARITRGYIVIVAAPAPVFDAQDNAGNSKRNFCINETIYLANQTPSVGSFAYQWEFYDDATGTTLLSTSSDVNPTYAYGSGGNKLIRLIATNPSAQGTCSNSFDLPITISPTLVAKIATTDWSGVPIMPDFCQQASAPLTSFQVRFNDASTGTVTATTQWRWEFRDQNNVLVLEEPGPGPNNFSDVQLGPFDQSFTTPGIYSATLITRDKVTGCSTSDVAKVYIYEKPVPRFTATRVCQGNATSFVESSTLNPINGEQIVLREWDFNYDGVNFVKDPAFDNQTTFSRSLGLSGTYLVALRVTTDQNACSDILAIPVRVDPLPTASFTADVTSGCSILKVNFTNTSIASEPDSVDRYVWEVDSGSGFQPVATQRPADPGFSNLFSYSFENVTSANVSFNIRLHVFTTHSCETLSAPVSITVFPGTKSGFSSINYSPFNDNCSPQTVNFSVDAETQSKNPTDYTWKISNSSGPVDQISTGTTPTFSYTFINSSTSAYEDFNVSLITTLASGCFGDSTRIIRINPIPSSVFSIDTILFDCQVMQLHFSATQKGLSQYHWSILENGINVFDQTSDQDVIDFQVNRPAPGMGDISLQVSLVTYNFANCQSPVTNQSITVPQQDNFNASFTVAPLIQSLPGSTVTITNQTNPGNWQFLWDFGDGTTSTASDPTIVHSYSTYGKFTIVLTVTSIPCIKTESQTVEIDAIPPIVDFTYDPPSGCAPLTVQFTDQSQFASPDTYSWSFGDGQGISHALDPVYTYYQPGIYTVTLSASNITGQVITNTKSMIIEVFSVPQADFAVKPDLVYIPGGLLYTSNRSLDATTFLWSFGDGTTSTEVQPEHQYKTEGVYDISLIAGNINGCSDTLTLNAAVHVQKGGQVLIPNAFTPNLTGPTGSNSNGKNDIFLPLTRGVVEFDLLVFNRWGQLLFESRDPQVGWDGYYNGLLCQQDVYVYKLIALYSNGEKVVRVGDINLIR
jgi:gliding motility-associated-like protein